MAGDHLYTRLGLNCFEVRENTFIHPGMVAQRGRIVFVRHLSEFCLALAGATWHQDGDACPTWTDATECRCMTEGSR
jgi:hypothetical protein